jgi:hypothetical protein
MEALRVSLSSQKTSQTVINVIIDGLQGWRHGVDHVFNITTTAGMLGDVQNKMGWEHFFEGRLHKAWREYHSSQRGTTKINHEGRRWVGAMVCKLHDITWDLWEHQNGILLLRKQMQK